MEPGYKCKIFIKKETQDNIGNISTIILSLGKIM